MEDFKVSQSGRKLRVDYTGKKFGKLTVLGLSEKCNKRSLFWECQCECGKTTHVRTTGLSRGTKSCGCLSKKHFKDVTGETRNKLTFISYFGKNNHKNNTWRVKCDCGKEIIAEFSDVNTGRIKSCGCLKTEKARETNSLAFGEASFNQVYRYYKSSAKQRGLTFELTKERFKTLTQMNCYYCNSEPENTKMNIYNNGHYVYNGLDRVNNDLGYTENNVLPCCKTCNFAKRGLSITEFKLWIQKLVKRAKENYNPKKEHYTISEAFDHFRLHARYKQTPDE